VRASTPARCTSGTGDAIASDTPGWVSYRRRRQAHGLQRGDVPLQAAIEQQKRLFAASEVMWGLARAMTEEMIVMLDVPGSGPRVDALEV
jgi:hypothetical protein